MEAISKVTDTSIPTSIAASNDAFLPLLIARKAQIASTSKKTFKYGSTDRHKLDVYYPPSGTNSAPILFFVYGGGFHSGARDLVPGLVYDNVGAFFAQRGILTIITDYRLMPAIYPDSTRDLHDALQFSLSSKEVGGDKTRVYIMGHSAGSAITTTLLLNEDFLSSEERAVIKGVVLSAGAHEELDVWAAYYGEPKEEAHRKTPLGILKSKSNERLKQLLPRVLMLIGEKDPPFLVDWDVTFKMILREKGFTSFQEQVIQGHNHISPNLALSSGEGEEWGEDVARWIKT